MLLEFRSFETKLLITMADNDNSPAQTGTTLAGRRVLVVEDDPNVRKAVGQLLAAEGCEIAMAADGAEGLAQAQQVLPEVIILDLSLPSADPWGGDFDGFGVMTWLERRLGRALPVVVLTGRQDEATRRQAEAKGVSAFITKPFNPRDLVAAVRNALK
jgi:CheY-like chemotaxis protein